MDRPRAVLTDGCTYLTAYVTDRRNSQLLTYLLHGAEYFLRS